MTVEAPLPLGASGAEPPEATIVVPCVRVESLTERCVAECARRHPWAEIVVLADIAEGAERVAGKCEVVVTGPVTIAAKRNLGTRRGRASLLAFIDSDAYPGEGWLDNALRHLRERPDLAAVGGPNIPPPDQTGTERWVGGALRSVMVSGPNAFRKRVAPARLVNDLPSCNLVVRRDAYLALGGMNEALFTGEDMDFCARLIGKGGKILYTPDVLVYHKNRNLRAFVLQRITFGASVRKLLETHGPNTTFLGLALPAAFWLFLATAPAAAFYPVWAALYGMVLAIYAVMAAAEAVRHAETGREIPGTLLALVIGNLAPGLGTWAEVLGLLPDLRRIYRNDHRVPLDGVSLRPPGDRPHRS